MLDFTHDPYTAVLDRLWAILEASPRFCATVKAANRIKLTQAAGKGKNPYKENKQDGDCPEVCIEPTTDNNQQAFTSQAARFTATFTIQLTTLDLRLATPDGTGMNQLSWIVWQLLTKAGDNLGLPFVIKTRLTAGLSHYQDPLTTKTLGWVRLWTLVCEFDTPKMGYPEPAL